MLLTTCSNIDLSAWIPSTDPNLIFKDFTVVPSSRIGIRFLTTSGGLIPMVTDVGVLGLGKPKSLYSGSPSFFACQSQSAVSRPT